jgi:hypothetical protein
LDQTHIPHPTCQPITNFSQPITPSFNKRHLQF